MTQNIQISTHFNYFSKLIFVVNIEQSSILLLLTDICGNKKKARNKIVINKKVKYESGTFIQISHIYKVYKKSWGRGRKNGSKTFLSISSRFPDKWKNPCVFLKMTQKSGIKNYLKIYKNFHQYSMWFFLTNQKVCYVAQAKIKNKLVVWKCFV